VTVIDSNVVEVANITDSSEVQGKNKLPFLSLELQVTIIKASISKMPVS